MVIGDGGPALWILPKEWKFNNLRNYNAGY